MCTIWRTQTRHVNGDCSQVEVFSPVSLAAPAPTLTRGIMQGLRTSLRNAAEGATLHKFQSSGPYQAEFGGFTLFHRNFEPQLTAVTVFSIHACSVFGDVYLSHFRWAPWLSSNSASLYRVGRVLLQETGALTLHRVTVMQSLQPRQHIS